MKNLQEKARRSRQTIQYCLFVISIIFLISSVSQAGILSLQQEITTTGTNYRIGAMDLLEIRVFELPELNQIVRVSEDGSISLTLLGKVDVVGLTAQDLEKKLVSILDQQYTKDAHVTVFIREYQKVAVLGAVMRPGMYELSGPTTLLHFIALAGGLTAQAMNELYVYRQREDGKQNRLAIKLDDLMIHGDKVLNIPLQPKDVITIPIDQIQNVFVYGEVKTPGVIQFLYSKKITLLQAIAQAGGTTDWAKKRSVMIKRIDKKTGKGREIRVNLTAVINGRVSDIELQDGDVVIVP